MNSVLIRAPADQIVIPFFKAADNSVYLRRSLIFGRGDETWGNYRCYKWNYGVPSEFHKVIKSILDTLLDTLEEGRHSFLEISVFPDLLKSSNPPLILINLSQYIFTILYNVI